MTTAPSVFVQVQIASAPGVAMQITSLARCCRKRWPKVRFAGAMRYDGDLQLPKHFLVDPPVIENVSGDYLCATGVRTFACSETQKFGHVTFFWNGNRSGFFDSKLETYVEVSPCLLLRFLLCQWCERRAAARSIQSASLVSRCASRVLII